MCPRRRCVRRRRGPRGVYGTGGILSSIGNFFKRGAKMLGNAFMKDPMKYINGAKNLYNAYKAAPTNGLLGRRHRRRRGGRRRKTSGAFDSLSRRTGGVVIITPPRRRPLLRRAAVRRALRR